MLFVKHAGQVTAPVASRPSCTLFQELRVVFQRSLDLGFRVVLHEGFPAMRHHPTGNEVVIVRIQLVFAEPPFLIGEGIGEHFILENLGAICDTASRHARQAAIHVRRSCTLKISALQVQGTQEIVDALGERWRSSTAQTLTGHHTTVPLVLLEGSQNPRHGSTRPAHVVIRKDCNGRADFWDGPSHLTALIGVSNGEQTNPRLGRGHGMEHVLSLLPIGLDCHQKKLVGPVVENCPDGLKQFITTPLQRWDDYRNILRGQFRVFRRRDGLEGPEGYEADNQAEVTIDAVQDKIFQSVNDTLIWSFRSYG